MQPPNVGNSNKRKEQSCAESCAADDVITSRFMECKKPKQEISASEEGSRYKNHDQGIPIIDLSLEKNHLMSYGDFIELYDYHQVMLFTNVTRAAATAGVSDNGGLSRNDVHALFKALNEKDQESWCIENDHYKNSKGDDAEPSDFLKMDCDESGYCSFLVQHDIDVKSVLLSKDHQDTEKGKISRLPIIDLPVEVEQASTSQNSETNESKSDDECNVVNETKECKLDDACNVVNNADNNKNESADVVKNISAIENRFWRYGPCLWFFFGRNKEEEMLQGRCLHTDSISHDGTWHYQFSGTKIWHLKPSKELQRNWDNEKNGEGKNAIEENSGSDGQSADDEIELIVECKEGDVIIVNTRLWWHKTTLPPSEKPSISYARDVYFSNNNDENISEDGEYKGNEMTNLDGLYAAEDIEVSTIVFRESTMPDCELHRSSDPNCDIIELEDGTGAIIAIRPIKAGEFFTVAESDDELDVDVINSENEDEDDEEIG